MQIVAGSECRAYSNSVRFTLASVAWLILSAVSLASADSAVRLHGMLATNLICPGPECKQL